MSRIYEPFKSEAKRLVSITCDRCGIECYATPGQPVGTLGFGKFWATSNYDLCIKCVEGIRIVIRDYIGKDPTR